jgi:hypothetical protein
VASKNGAGTKKNGKWFSKVRSQLRQEFCNESS